MKVKRIAYLDDDPLQVKIFKKHIENFNNRDEGEKVELECFSRAEDFERYFDHDYAVIDIDLNSESFNGFKMAEYIMKKHSCPVILMSGYVKEDEALDSFISKVGFKTRDILNKFEALNGNMLKNSLQIFTREKSYNVAG